MHLKRVLVFILCIYFQNFYSQTSEGVGASFTYTMNGEDIDFRPTLFENSKVNRNDVISNLPADYIQYMRGQDPSRYAKYYRGKAYFLNQDYTLNNYAGKINITLEHSVQGTYKPTQSWPSVIVNPGSVWSRYEADEYYSDGYTTQRSQALGIPNEVTGRIPWFSKYHVPDTFWDNNDFAWFLAEYTTHHDYQSPNPLNAVPGYKAWRSNNWTSNWKQYSDYNPSGITMLLYPYFIKIDPANENSQYTPITLKNNDGPKPFWLGPQSGYANSRSWFSAFAQDKEGDELVYRWDYPYVNQNQNDGSPRMLFRDGYSETEPLYKDTHPDDYFYLNPYSGYIDYVHKENLPGESNIAGLRRSSVAIDQYHDGQLVSTTHYEVPFFAESIASNNQFPEITISSSENIIGEKTSYDYEVDNPAGKLPRITDYYNSEYRGNNTVYNNNYSAQTIAGIYKIENQFPFVAPPNNNSRVLLEAVDISESETVSLDISYSDPDGDAVNFRVVPVFTNLFDTYPETFSDDKIGNATWSWTPPTDLNTLTSLNHKVFMFMLYAHDNAGELPSVPGRTIKPFSVTVHKKPSLVISSDDMQSGEQNSESTIDLKFKITGIDNDELLAFTEALTAEDFDITNASLTSFSNTDSTTFTATLSPSLDPTTQTVSISIALANDKFTVKKQGGHNINFIELKNSASNLFLWTTNRVPLTVSYDFFDSTGNTLNDNATTNDPYIIAKIQTSHPTNDFTLSDITISGSFQKEFTKVDSQNYIVKISKAGNPTAGSINFSISSNKFENEFGKLNSEGRISQSIDNLFTWNYDYFIRQITIEDLGQPDGEKFRNIRIQQAIGGADEPLYESGNLLTSLTVSQTLLLENKLNKNITNGYISDANIFSTNDNSGYRLFDARLYPNAPNSNVTVTLPLGLFADDAGNLTNEVSQEFSFNLTNTPWLTNFYSIESNAQGAILTNLTQLTTTVLVGFAGQASGDRGFNGSSDSSLSTYALLINDFITSSNATINSLNYFDIGNSQTIDGQTVTEQLFEIEIVVTQPGDVVIELAENSFTNSSSVSNTRAIRTLTYDNTPPTITFTGLKSSGAELQNNSTTDDSFIYLIATASEPISDFSIADIAFETTNGKTGFLSNFRTISNSKFEIKLTPDKDGDYIVYSQSNSFKDNSGLLNLSNSSTFNWSSQRLNPTVTINVYNGSQKISQNEFTKSMVLSATYEFSETVSYTGDLINILSGTISNVTINSASFNQDNTKITASITVDNPGVATLSLNAGTFYDIQHNLSLKPSSVNWTSNPNIPGVSIEIYDGSTLLSEGEKTNATSLTIHYNVDQVLGSEYSEYSDSQIQNILNTRFPAGLLSGFSKTGTGSLTATFSNFTKGILTFDFPSNILTIGGLNNKAAIPVSVDVDNVPPTATFQLENNVGSIQSGDLIKSQTATLTISTSEDVVDLSVSDITISGPVTISNFTSVNSTTYKVSLSHDSNASGTVSITLGNSKYEDAYANSNTTTNTFSYDVDVVLPTVSYTLWYETGTSTATISDGETLAINEFYAQINFSEDVTTISKNQLNTKFSTILNATSSNTTIIDGDISVTSSSTLLIKTGVTNGTVGFTVPSLVASDPAGNFNTAAQSPLSFTVLNAASLDKVEWSTNTPNEGSRTSPSSTELHGMIQNGLLPKKLYAKEGAEISLNIEASQGILEPQVTFKINGTSISNVVTYTPISSNTNYKASFTVSSDNPEGIVSFTVSFTTAGGTRGPLVSETTDDIKTLVIDKTPPDYKLNYYYVDNGVKNYFVEGQFIPAEKVVNFDVESNDEIYEILYANQNNTDKLIPKQKYDSYWLGQNYSPYDGYSGQEQKWVNVFGQERFVNFSGENFYVNQNTTYSGSGGLYKQIYVGTTDVTNGFRLIYHDDFPKNRSHLGGVELNDVNTITHPAGFIHDLAGNGVTSNSFKVRVSAPDFLNGTHYSGVPEDLTICKSKLLVAPSKQVSVTIQLNTIPTVESVSLPSLIWEITTDPTSNNWDTIESLQYVSGNTSSTFRFSTNYNYNVDTNYYLRLRLQYNSDLTIKYHRVTEFFKVKFTAPPVITGDSFICGVGNTLQLSQTATLTTSTTNPWTSSDTSVATVDSSGLVTAVGTGEVVISYTNGQCDTTQKISVYESQSDQLTIVANGNTAEVCVGETVVLTASSIQKGLWYKDGQPISDYSTLTLAKVEDSGLYIIKKTTPCGTITSNAISVTIKPLQNTTKINQNN